MKTPAEQWEALARQQRYFPLLTHDGALHAAASEEATSQFFETGESDISSLLTAATSILGEDVSLTSALDFGCGAGRLTLPIARRATAVMACDVAPTMLAEVSANARKVGLNNVTCATPDQVLALPDGTFSFICSLLVLQYLPRADGYKIIRALLRLLASNGVALLHVLIAPDREALRQLIRVNRVWSGLKSIPVEPSPVTEPIRLYAYDELVVRREIDAASVRIVGRVSAPAESLRGEVLILRKGLATR